MSLTSNPPFKINQSLFSLQYILMLDICKVSPCISVCQSLHDLNHYNFHISYPLWLALTTSVCWTFCHSPVSVFTLYFKKLKALKAFCKIIQQIRHLNTTGLLQQRLDLFQGLPCAFCILAFIISLMCLLLLQRNRLSAWKCLSSRTRCR